MSGAGGASDGACRTIAQSHSDAGAAETPNDSIDRAQLGALLRTILRVRTRVRRTIGRGKPRGLIFLVVIYAIMGGFTGMIAFLDVDVFTYAIVLGSMTMFLAGMTMVAESSQLLFNTQEHDILGHRPVGPRTLLLARSLSLFGLTLLLTLSLNLLPMFFGLWASGARPWFPLGHLIAISLLSFFCAGAVVFVYVALTRLVGRERFDNIASWFQLGVSVTFILGSQIIPRMISHASGFHIAPELPWLMILPPAWFAATEALIAGRMPASALPHLVPMAAAGVIATLALSWAAFVRLAGDYARRVAALSEIPVAPPRTESARRARGVAPSGLRALGSWIARGWMPDPVERAAFRLTALYMRRDRELRMRLYPSLASYLVFPILAVIDPQKLAIIPLMTVVMAAMLPAGTMMTLKSSTQYAAAEVFRYAPIGGTASLFHGVRKAAIAFMTLPVLAISAALLIAVLRDRTWLIAIIPGLLVMPSLSLIEGLTGDYLPLSQPPQTGRQGAINIGLYALSALVAGGLGAVGYFARRQGWFWQLITIEVIVVATIHFMLLRGIRARRLAPLA